MERVRTSEIKPLEILQIIPADGWFAGYYSKGEGMWKEPLICWALIRVNNRETVVGVEEGKNGETLLTPTDEGFKNYHHSEKDEL